MRRSHPYEKGMMLYNAIDRMGLYLVAPVEEFFHIGRRRLHKPLQGIQHVQITPAIGVFGLLLQAIGRFLVRIGFFVLFLLHHVLGGLDDQLFGLEIVLHAGSLFAQFLPGLVNIEVEIGILFEIGAGIVGPVEQAIDQRRLIAKRRLDLVLVFIQLEALFTEQVGGHALGEKTEVGLHFLVTEQLILPELGIQFQGYHVRIP